MKAVKAHCIFSVILVCLFVIPVYAQWEYGGIVICPDTWSTYDLNSCSDRQHGIILAWEDYREQYNSDIFVQRVDSAGYELWQENGVQAVTNPYGQYYPQIAPDGSGGVFVAWTDLGRIQPNRYSVYAQYIDSSGNLVWPDSGIQIFDDGSNHWAWRIIPDNSGGAIIMWDDPAMVQRVDSAGNLLFNNTDGLRMTDSLYNQSNGWLLNSSDSNFIAIWFDGRQSGLGPGIYAQKFSSDGQILWGSDGIPVAVSPINTDREVFDISPGLNGDFYAIWENVSGPYQGIWMQYVNNQGLAMWGNNGMVIASGNYRNPVITTNQNGEAIISWRYGQYPHEGYLNLIDTTGSRLWVDDVSLGHVSSFYGITQILPNQIEIGFETSILSCRQRVLKYDIVDGFMWGDTGVCLICPSCPSYKPQIISDGIGGAYLSWKRFDAGWVMLNRVYPDGWVVPDTSTAIFYDYYDQFNPVVSTSCYPNPFNSHTKIEFEFSQLGYYEINLYDILGRLIKEIFHGELPEYTMKINLDLSSEIYKSGIYFVKINHESHYSSKKITLIK
jgi:hypothetical protein